MKLSIIVASNQQGIIGINGQIPWHIPEDLKRFKQLTMGKPIIMGRKTFESLGSKPLPGRLNVVVSPSKVQKSDYDYELGVLWTDSLRTALRWLELPNDYEEVFVIGGERLYREAIPLADTIYRTRVDRVWNLGPATKAAYCHLEISARWYPEDENKLVCYLEGYGPECRFIPEQVEGGVPGLYTFEVWRRITE